MVEHCCCRSSKYGLRPSDRERSRHSGQHPVHGTGRSPDTNLDLQHRESPATSPRARHVMSPGMSACTRHGTVYRSRSPDEYKKSRDDDLLKWTVESDYDTSQLQQHSSSQVLLPLLLFRVATHLENLEKLQNLKVVRENRKRQGKCVLSIWSITTSIDRDTKCAVSFTRYSCASHEV